MSSAPFVEALLPHRDRAAPGRVLRDVVIRMRTGPLDRLISPSKKRASPTVPVAYMDDAGV